MGKIVKFCSSCDEGFAEKFGFCPNCAAPLEAFELNPLAHVAKAEEAAIEPPTPSPIEIEESSPLRPADETPVYDDGYGGDTTPLYAENVDVIEEEAGERYEPAVTAPAFAAAVPDTVPAFHYDAPTYDTASDESYETAEYSREDDGGYSITVIEEKNGKQRNLLLLGSFFLMMTLSVGGTIVSLFQKDLGIGAIGDERSLAYLIDEVPMPAEEKEEPKKDDDEDGGGGGGGKKDPEPVNQGDLPDQVKNPLRPPDPKVHRSDTFELKMPVAATEGNQKNPKVFNQYGDPNSRFGNLSSGPGSGGGMGTGIGTGAGSGRGTGQGSGSGSGSGSGDGSGNGDGSGLGSGGNPPPPRPVGVTTALRIISKPRAQYTDAGRTASVQGVVRLKVTLLASGQIGSITPISRLPHGMTEQAIAAARQIRFEPKKVNGVPISVVQTVEYTFSLY